MIFHPADLNIWQLLQDIQREVRELREGLQGQAYQEDQMVEVVQDKLAEVLKDNMGDILEEDAFQDGIGKLEQKVDDLTGRMNRVEQMTAVVCRPSFSKKRCL